MAKPAKPSGIAADIAAMREIGMTNEQIQARLMGQPAVTVVQTLPSVDDQGRAGTAAPALDVRQRQDQANLGPDPEMVARQKEFLATYVPPILERVYEVTLPVRRADYIERACAYENAVRVAQSKQRNSRNPPKEITPAEMIAIIVGKYWLNDPDRALHQGGIGTGTSMPRSEFSAPPAGTPPSVPQG